MTNELEKVVEILKNGGIILYPTDTIWGIGCDATNDDAIQKIYQLKKRNLAKSMIVLVESEGRLQKIVDVPDLAWTILDYAEKPTTIIYDAPKGLSNLIIADDNSVGIRITKHDFCKKIITKLGKPIVSTSANFSGDKTPQTFNEISIIIKESVDYMVELIYEEKITNQPSTIIKLGLDSRVKIIRE